ncbi:MAG: alpha/beta hydrolase [Clostridiales bacterium]|nr:alpha/beta hydrolase [Clostridiales bacterium]
MKHETFYFNSADGLSRIFAQRWLPDGQPRGVVQLLHGMCEHSSRYKEFATFLNEAGFAVIAHDHIGHGNSVAKGQRYGFLAEQGGWGFALKDIEQVHSGAQFMWPGLPHFIFGHSMGSFLLRSYLLTSAAVGLSGAIISGTGFINNSLFLWLSGCMVWIEKKRLGAKGISPLLNLAVLGKYNRHFRPNRTAVDWISGDNDMADAFLADPFCRKLPTVGLYDDVSKAWAGMASVAQLKYMDSSLPLLLISGNKDPVGKNGRDVKKLYLKLKEAGCRDISLKLYPDARHALLHETNREQVFVDLLVWLNRKIVKKDNDSALH